MALESCNWDARLLEGATRENPLPVEQKPSPGPTEYVSERRDYKDPPALGACSCRAAFGGASLRRFADRVGLGHSPWETTAGNSLHAA